MIEHVGHDYMEEFFTCCESALTEDGLLALQVIDYSHPNTCHFDSLCFSQVLAFFSSFQCQTGDMTNIGIAQAS